MDRATEFERAGDVCCWEAFGSIGQAEYVDSVSTEDDRLDVPVEYRCWTERKLLQEIAELKAEINRLRGARRWADANNAVAPLECHRRCVAHSGTTPTAIADTVRTRPR
jgi:hypothetical protein